MEYRVLGKSGLQVSVISFGAGPISGLMVGDDEATQQLALRRAIESGVNWFDTAATYGDGQSERSLGAAVRACPHSGDVHIATKVRLAPDQLEDIPAAIRASFDGSLNRLDVDRVTLLQLHNSITRRRGDLPTSVTVNDVLGPRGVVNGFEMLRREGRVGLFGFTGLGDMQSLQTVIRNGPFTSAQVPLSLLTPTAGQDRSAGSVDVDYEQLVDECGTRKLGVIAIRVFAGGALVGQDPSPHTYRTKFFPLDLFQRDQQRAHRLAQALPTGPTLSEASVRYVLSLPQVTTALIGFSDPTQIDDALKSVARGPLDESSLSTLRDYYDNASETKGDWLPVQSSKPVNDTAGRIQIDRLKYH